MRPEDRYNELREEVLKNIELLRKKIDNHEKEFKKDPENWGFIGDLSYWNEKLIEIST